MFSIWSNLNRIIILLPVFLALQISFLLKTKQKQENTFYLMYTKRKFLHIPSVVELTSTGHCEGQGNKWLLKRR